MTTKRIPRKFLLKSFVRSEDEWGLALYSSSNGNLEDYSELIVRIWGNQMKAVMDHILETIKKAGYKPSSLSKSRQAPFDIDESYGVRLGLLFMAVKPLRKTIRIEKISEHIRSMGNEEIYYWFSKCAFGHDARRARKAFRILEAKE